MGLPGQAARDMGATAHRVCHWLLSGFLLLGLVVLGLAWRLAQGPLDAAFLGDALQRVINARIAPAQAAIGGVSLAWDGFTHGVGRPLRIRLTDVTVTAPGGTSLRLPVLEAAVSARGLLAGRLQPRAITLEGARLAVIRARDGTIGLRFGEEGTDDANRSDSSLLALLTALGQPATTDGDAAGRAPLGQLRSLSILGAAMVFDDRLSGRIWTAERGDIALSRREGGGVDGRAALVVAAGDGTAELNVDFALAEAGRSSHLAARLSAPPPRVLAGMAPALAPLARLDAPVAVEAEADLDADFRPVRFRAALRAEAGKIDTDAGSIPFRRAALAVSGAPEDIKLEAATIELLPRPDGPVTTLRAEGRVTHRAGRVGVALSGTLDRIPFADIARIWPPDIAPPARTWVTENLLGGTARDGKFRIAATAPEDFSDVALTQVAASLEGDDITATWMPTIPPVERGRAHLSITDPDRIEIDIPTGRQTVRGGAPLILRDGRVVIAGLAKKDQDATITFAGTGNVVDVLALLREPRLKILDKHPMNLRDPAGEMRMTARIVVPLKRKVAIDDLTIQVNGDLAKVHLTGIVGGRDLDDGAVAMEVDTNHLSFRGTGRVADIPADLAGTMDFRDGPPTQESQRYTASGRVTAPELAKAGLDPGDFMTGEAQASAVAVLLRNGQGEVRIEADLTRAALGVTALRAGKPPGVPAKGTGRVRLARDKVAGIEAIVVDGPGISVRAAVAVRDGRMETIRLERGVLGRTNVSGTIGLPRDGPIVLDLRGPAVDASARVREKPPKQTRGAPEPPPGSPVSLRGRFDTVFLANDQAVRNVAIAAEHDGSVMRSLALTGMGGTGKPFSAEIVPLASGRRLALGVGDAGGLLRGLDITDTVRDGALVLRGDYDDTTREHTLTGTLDMSDFRVSRAQSFGKLLQALTLYGLADALSGPGLSFDRVIAPFRFGTDTITVSDVRAFSPSLGVTAKGGIDRITDRLDLEGTVVPAYVLNSMLGRIPGIGTLFRNETGGGLIAMNYSLRGPMDDPSVMANPFSALTPGILRGMFDVFDKTPPAGQTADVPAQNR